MATKDIYTNSGITNEGKTIVARVFWNDEWEEYRVKVSIDGVAQKKATYHTDDKDDAIGTANHIVGEIPAILKKQAG